MKKLLAVLMTMMLLLSMVSVAVAEGGTTTTTYTITIKPNDGATHIYEVYQIFTGDVTTDATGATVLTNVQWGKNAKSNNEEATDVADKLVAKSATASDYCDFTSNAIDTITTSEDVTTYVSKGLVPGYYLIKDQNGSLKDQDGAYTLLVVKILSKDIEVNAKSANPKVDKQVQDEVTDQDETATGNDGWGESADHALFENFKFKLVAKLGNDENFGKYDTYTVKFTDTMSKGVTFVQLDSVTVNGTSVADADYVCTATAGQAGGSWTLTIADITKYTKTLLNANVEVIYTAYLNENAQTFNASADATENENKVYLEYSNNPNANGANDLGKTPKDSVWLFTYTVNNTKYANTKADENKLAGAGFKLYDASGAEVKLLVKKTDNDGNYLVYDGTEAKIPADYMVLANNEMITTANGVFNIIGLDHGVYTLKETTVPQGYNKMDDNITISVTAEHKEVQSGASATMVLDEGSKMNNDIINKSGATLPETGGIGTTIFYLVGGMMFAGAALMLVVRRKAEADEE